MSQVTSLKEIVVDLASSKPQSYQGPTVLAHVLGHVKKPASIAPSTEERLAEFGEHGNRGAPHGLKLQVPSKRRLTPLFTKRNHQVKKGVVLSDPWLGSVIETHSASRRIGVNLDSVAVFFMFHSSQQCQMHSPSYS